MKFVWKKIKIMKFFFAKMASKREKLKKVNMNDKFLQILVFQYQNMRENFLEKNLLRLTT